jgi:hypothetical protein
MKRTTAIELAGLLAGCTPGWTEDSLTYTIEHIERQWVIDWRNEANIGLPSEDTLGHEAIDAICNSWQHGHRPPWGVLREAWERAVGRARLRVVGDDERDNTNVGPPRGGFEAWREFAVREYVTHVHREGRPPNPEYIAKIRTMKGIGGASLFKTPEEGQ